MTHFLVIIDGPKGAGKSTLAELLVKAIPHTELFSIDGERKLIEKTGDRDADNRSTFLSIVQKLEGVFTENRNAVVDSAVFGDRLLMLENVAKKHGVRVLAFSLTAPQEVLRRRVKEREEGKGRKFDEERFNHLLRVVENRSFEGFTVLDTEKLSPWEMFEAIYAKI